MFEKLSRVEERYNKIAADLCDPAVVADISRYTALMKEQKHLTPVVETFARYKKCTQTYCERWRSGVELDRLAVADRIERKS